MKQIKKNILIVLCLTSINCGFNSIQAQTVTENELSAIDLNTNSRPRIWTLNECIQYALNNNINLRKDRISAKSAYVDQLTAKSALFPSLSFSTSQNVVNRPFQESTDYVSNGEILKSNSKTSYNGNYGLNAQWVIYNGGKRLKTIEQEKINTNVSLLEVSSSENSIEETILQSYVQIMYAMESVIINENTLAVSRAQHERGKELLAAGSLSRVDVAQLESQVSSDNYQLVTAQMTLENYKLQLKQLLEIDEDEEMNIYMIKIDNNVILAPLQDKSEVYQAALAMRPEIEASRLNIEASVLGIDIARSGYMPTISLTAGVGTNNTSGTDYTFSNQVKNGWNNSAGVTVSVPIFNNRQTKSAVEKAKLQHETSVLNLQDQQKELYRIIEGYWQDAYSAQQKYVAAEMNESSAQTSYELISEQFNLGMKNILDLLTEKNNYASARQEALQAKYLALLNAQLLRFYQGEKINL